MLRYIYPGSLYSPNALNKNGYRVPYSSLPVLRMEYALYPNDVSSCSSPEGRAERKENLIAPPTRIRKITARMNL
jgi:hypothetical protein